MNRYPDLTEYFEDNDIVTKVGRLVDENMSVVLSEKIEQFKTDPITANLEEICYTVAQSFPLNDVNGMLLPMLTISEHIDLIEQGIHSSDCKLLTVVTAYITSKIFNLPTVISVRCYSAHPILYVNVSDEVVKVSYLHEKVDFKMVESNNPFEIVDENNLLNEFEDSDFTHTSSILFWNVKEGLQILDKINLLRRCAVNFVNDKDRYTLIFNQIISTFNVNDFFQSQIVDYWQSEFDRIKDIYDFQLLRSKGTITVNEFKESIIQSLRFI